MADQPDNPGQFRFRGFRAPHYTQVPDDLFDELLTELSGAELKVTLYIIRRTFGFKKSSDNISISQMLRGITTRDGRQLDRGVGLSKSTLLQAVRGCTEKGIIIPTRRESAERGNEATNYRLNLVGIRPTPASPNDDEDPSEDDDTSSKGSPPLVQKSDQGGSRNQTKGLVGKSDPQDTVRQETDKVVTALTDHDQRSLLKGTRPPRPEISDRALAKTYGLSAPKIAEVHRLVQMQADVLGSVEQNHAHYVKRAAEAVAAGDGQFLDATLGDYKQAATAITVKSPPRFFHTMWLEALQKRENRTIPGEVLPRGNSPHPGGFERLGNVLDRPTHIPQEPADDDRITRLIEAAESRGLPVPEHIRQSSNYGQVARWWATLSDASHA